MDIINSYNYASTFFKIVADKYTHIVYPKKYAHGFVVLCFVVATQSFKVNSHEVFIHIHQGCFASTGAIVRLPQCQWSKPDGYGNISQCITTTKHSNTKTVCIFQGIYCTCLCIVILILHIYIYIEHNGVKWDNLYYTLDSWSFRGVIWDHILDNHNKIYPHTEFRYNA